MPSALASKVRHRPRGDSACVFENAMKSSGFWQASQPPTIAMSALPVSISRAPIITAASDEPQAASTVKFTPPRSKRLATRPAITFKRIPGKLSSVHSGRRAAAVGGIEPFSAGSDERTA